MNISLDYTLTYDEWAQAFHASNRSMRQRRPPILVLIITAALLAALLILLTIRHIHWLPSRFFFLTPVLLIGVLFWFMLQRKLGDLAKTEWDSNPTLRGRCTITLNDSALTITQEFRQATWQWPAFVKFDESKNLLLLYISQRSFLPIPKRAFASSELDTFLQFLMKTMPPANPASAGFSVIPKPLPPTPIHVQPLESRDFM
ncbi:MAG TPA: YcxB family protein [Tepidisphaeraceae bacterium]|jgi:hypothetical protein|nr:YcxB family protein [Tepidisphaeraceae bacterium]